MDTITLRDVTVGQILKEIGQKGVFSIPPTATVRDASVTMTAINIGALLVMESGSLVGIVSERDINMRCVAPNRDPDSTLVSQIMTPDPETVRPLTVSIECEEIMKRLNARHLPVTNDKGEVTGVISMRDILVVTRKDQQFLAGQLVGYVRGEG
jgi:CBS domain-containing protein